MAVRKIALTRGLFATVDEQDYAALMAMGRWQVLPGRHTSYAVHNCGGRNPIRMHRVIMAAPAGQEVDHRDRDGLNNTRSNLRLASDKEQAWNKRIYRNNTSGFRGVYRRSTDGKWIAQVAGRHVGVFTTAEDASNARDAVVSRLAGEFGALNSANQVAS